MSEAKFQTIQSCSFSYLPEQFFAKLGVNSNDIFEGEVNVLNAYQYLLEEYLFKNRIPENTTAVIINASNSVLTESSIIKTIDEVFGEAIGYVKNMGNLIPAEYFISDTGIELRKDYVNFNLYIQKR